MEAAGREPDSLKILPAEFVVVGETVDAAQELRGQPDSLVHYESSIASLSNRQMFNAAGLLCLESSRP